MSLLFSLVVFAVLAPAAPWAGPLAAKLESLDRSSLGELGVYVKRLGDGSELSYRGDRYWYLSSTVKVPVAVALLKKVEKGELSLSRELTLQKSDYVDGAGDLQRTAPGKKLSLRSLLERMLVHSDSTAADMLIRLIGVDYLNKSLGQGFRDFTTILQVRFDAYGELHPGAKKLANTDFLELKKTKSYPKRREEFASRIDVSPGELRASTIEEAFERYYDRGLNSASLEAYGHFLERLAEGKLLNEEHTKLLLGFMEKITTGEHRLKAGFPKGTEFAQKTGTQVRRICNMGIVDPAHAPLVVTACVEKFPSQAEAENLLKKVGKALVEAGLVGSG